MIKRVPETTAVDKTRNMEHTAGNIPEPSRNIE